MKKLFLSLLSLVISMTIFAQSNVRKMNLIYDGQVVYSRAVSLIDSIKFVWSDGSGSDDDITGGEVDPSKQLYVGVVAFNRDVRQMAITSDMEAVKAFINEQTNDKDFTAFAYSVSQGNKQFDAAGLPEFDNIFMLNFSDGTDNYSNMKWGEEGRIVNNNFAYDTARYDLSSRVGLNSYAIGFGAKEADFREKMKKIVMGSGSYYAAASSSDLQPTFNEIAKSMLASAKNVLLKTNPGYYVGFYKYFRLSFVAEDGSTDHIYAQMDGTPTTGYTLSISKTDNGYAYFDAPAKGVVDDETGKVHIPLNNLKFVKDGKDLQYKFTIEVSFDGESYYEDVEEASTAEEISKRIAVVLVLDCSTSMGDAFAPMKAAAVDFIKTMEKMEVDDSEPNIPDPNTGGTQTFTVNGVSFTMVGVEGGTFTMGATSEQGTSDPYDDEYPTHSVTLSDFAIGETEVTQELWQAVMGNNPSYFSGTNLPVEYVTWNDCQTFISRLNSLTGKNFRLPTEAEWEYAARGGNKSRGYKYAGSNTLSDVAWYSDNSSSKTHPVKQKQANELGLYDMSGNVHEWCQDWFGTYSSSAQTNPTGPASGSNRVFRGGSWYSNAGYCRVSSRYYITPTYYYNNLGFRLAL